MPHGCHCPKTLNALNCRFDGKFECGLRLGKPPRAPICAPMRYGSSGPHRDESAGQYKHCRGNTGVFVVPAVIKTRHGKRTARGGIAGVFVGPFVKPNEKRLLCCGCLLPFVESVISKANKNIPGCYRIPETKQVAKGMEGKTEGIEGCNTLVGSFICTYVCLFVCMCMRAHFRKEFVQMALGTPQVAAPATCAQAPSRGADRMNPPLHITKHNLKCVLMHVTSTWHTRLESRRTALNSRVCERMVSRSVSRTYGDTQRLSIKHT